MTVTWVGGLLFAFAAVFAAQGLSRYVAIRCVEILAHAKLPEQEIDDAKLKAIESATVQYIMAKVAATQSKQKKKPLEPEITSEVEIPSFPLGMIPTTSHQNGSSKG